MAKLKIKIHDSGMIQTFDDREPATTQKEFQRRAEEENNAIEKLLKDKDENEAEIEVK